MSVSIDENQADGGNLVGQGFHVTQPGINF